MYKNVYSKSTFFLKKSLLLITILGVLLSASHSFDAVAQSNKPDKAVKPKKKKKAKLPPEDITGAMLANAQYSFKPSTLNGAIVNNPTSIQFGPDGRLYVSEQAGLIKVFSIKQNAPSDYAVTKTETINIINQIVNHNDDGNTNTTVTTRQVTGILLRGTAANPIIYVASSDSRIGGPSGDLNLDTNSGIISQLSWNGTNWVKTDLVRGLPRSEENHANNGMQLDDRTNTLYVVTGGNTNAGSPSNNFAFTTEYALSAAILSIDLNAINSMSIKGTGNAAYKYDLPTLDDPTRTNNPDGSDTNDPFGGNDGLNQAKIVPGGPVQIYSPGYRNAFDLVLTQARNLYTVDNGANQGWGGYPENEGTVNVTNNYVPGEPGSSSPSATQKTVNNLDNLHFVCNIDTYKAGSAYGGHPNPVRANPAGAGLYTRSGTTGVFRTIKTGTNPLPSDWPPIPVANPAEASFKMPGVADNSLLTFPSSTNGLAEYTASNFGNALKGALLACDLNGSIVKLSLTSDGTNVTNPKDAATRLNQDLPFASNFGSQPLDITTQPDGAVFPGTVWVAVYGAKAVTIFEPQDAFTCSGLYNDSDDDGDHFSNADEIDNASQPCSASSIPPDNDADFISDLNDVDDDNDGISDSTDLFALDANNGLTSTFTNITYDLFNNYPGTGLFGLGFTGLMTNNLTDYSEMYEDSNLIAGGAVGAFSIVKVTSGDCYSKQNNQENAFQFAINPKGSSFTVQSRILGPFFNNQKPVNFQSQGIYIGTGDQDNYLKIVLNANGGAGGIQVLYENAGVPKAYQYAVSGALSASAIDLYLVANPAAGTVQAQCSLDAGQVISLGSPIPVSGAVLNALKGTTAVGIIATSTGASPFTATWDYIYVTSSTNTWNLLTSAGGAIIGREENGYVALGNKAYLMGGRGIVAVQEYDALNNTWTNKAAPPIELNHFQPVVLNGLIYVVGAMNGGFPREAPIPLVYTYNPSSNVWAAGSTIPLNRRRGAAGAVVYNNKIYVVSGITDGHWSGWVPWLDEYDPATNTWRTLPDAPRSRDHFHAVVINNKLYLTGGRRSSQSTGHLFDLTVPETDVYDFVTNTWSTLPAGSNIPTQRAGASNVVVGNEIFVIGGESGSQPEAHKETEALDVTTNTWRRLADLQQGRHGTGAVLTNNSIYIASGPSSRGGSPLLTTQEVYLSQPSTVSRQQVTSLTLVNSTTDQDIQTITEGAVFDLSALTSRSLNIRANTSPGIVGSVVLTLSGTETRNQIEGSFPYSLFGDNNGNYIDWPATPGTYKLVATPYTDINGGGIAGISLTINFSIINGNTTSQKVSSFTLVNADTDQDMQTLANGTTLNLATLPGINIRAITNPISVGSVKFELTGAQTKTQIESAAPYSLFLDDNGNYRPGTLAVGSYNLKATPYSGGNTSGTAGTPLTISFNVVNQQPAIAARKATTETEQKTIQPEKNSVRLYPNPNGNGLFNVVLPNKIQGTLSYALISSSGSNLRRGTISLKKPTSIMNFDFSKEMTATGEYYLTLNGQELKAQLKVIKIK